MVFLSGQNPNIYTANYNDPENSKAFRDFKADMSRHLKLLYCIDMLNEGVHVDDIDGVILLRPTVSPIIYMQQIGRCLSAGNTQTPDRVDNFESLYSIEVLRDDIDEAFSMIPCTDRERHKFQERFEIYDKLRDCRSFFSMLQQSLSSTWDNYYDDIIESIEDLDRKIERLQEKVIKKHKEYSVLAEELSTLLDERHPERKIERVKQALYDAYVKSERSLD